jgi:hypothetical protein
MNKYFSNRCCAVRSIPYPNREIGGMTVTSRVLSGHSRPSKIG